jgi:uncharacterized membrane-anchored protein YitT (DUF2179 family)
MTRLSERIHWRGFLSPSTVLQTVIGVGLAVFALKGFMVPNHFLDGGVIGISILSSEVTEVNLSVFLLLGNVPFMVLAWLKVSREVALKSTIAIVLLSAGLEFIPIDPVTTNEVLIAVFGGAILGIGVGLVIRSGGAVDGTEILALLTTRRIGLSITEVILAINIILFAIAGAVFEDIEVVMYSIITYFTAGKAIDYIVDGVEEYTALTVIASKSDDVKDVIVNQFGKGITVYRGERGYLPGSFDQKTECDIIVTIVTRLELLSIKKAIHSADPTAFTYVSSIKEASGGVIKKRGHDRG